MRTNTVTFRGKQQVLDAYVANDMAAWSLWASKEDMPFAYEGYEDGISVEEGADYLAQCIDKLKKGGSEASYQLKVYDNWEPGAKLTMKSVPSRSFRFGLWELEGGEGSPYDKRTSGLIGRLEERLDQIQGAFMGKILEKIDQDDKREEDEPKKSGIAGVVEGLWSVPEIQTAVVGKILGWVSSVVPMKKPAAVAGVIDTGQAVEIAPDQYKKLEQAIPLLARVDPLLGDHLLALARMAHNEPGKYKMALSFL